MPPEGVGAARSRAQRGREAWLTARGCRRSPQTGCLLLGPRGVSPKGHQTGADKTIHSLSQPKDSAPSPAPAPLGQERVHEAQAGSSLSLTSPAPILLTFQFSPRQSQRNSSCGGKPELFNSQGDTGHTHRGQPVEATLLCPGTKSSSRQGKQTSRHPGCSGRGGGSRTGRDGTGRDKTGRDGAGRIRRRKHPRACARSCPSWNPARAAKETSNKNGSAERRHLKRKGRK